MKYKKILYLLLFILSCISLITAIWYYLEFQTIFKKSLQLYQSNILENSESAANNIENTLKEVELAANNLAKQLSSGELAVSEYKNSLKTMVLSQKHFYGGTIAFDQYQFDKAQRLYAPYYCQDGYDRFIQIEEQYDYTDLSQEWFVSAMAKGSRWSAPYFDDSLGNILMVTYSAVFFDPSDKERSQPKGVVTIDLSIDTIFKQVHKQSLGNNSYTELITSKGKFLYSPNDYRVLNKQNLFDLIEWQSSDIDWLKNNIKNQTISINKVTKLNNEKFWFSVAPINKNWSIVSSFKKYEMNQYNSKIRTNYFLILLFSVITLFLLILALHLSINKNVISWFPSNMAAIVFIIAIVLCWDGHLSYPIQEDLIGVAINDKASQLNTIEAYTAEIKKNSIISPDFINTGIYITTLHLNAENTLSVDGYLWQRIHKDKKDKKGFKFIGASYTKLTNHTMEEQDDYIIYRWDFSSTFRYRFDYYFYPFLKSELKIGILSKHIDGSIQLIPDVDSYKILSPIYLPGIDPNVFIAGWDINKSHFSMQDFPFTSSLGDYQGLTHNNVKVMYLNIDVSKRYVTKFITYLTPILIIAIIIFIILFIATDDPLLLKAMRTGISFELGMASSMLFILSIAHIDLRESINTQDVFYFEFFYLLMYFNLLWLCIHAILTVNNRKLLDRLTYYVPAKFIFLPANTAILFMITWFVFH
jgi:hypothetical protein